MTPPKQAEAVLLAAASWTETGWDTTKAAKIVRALTGLAIVSNTFQEYLNVFVFSLSLLVGGAGNSSPKAKRQGLGSGVSSTISAGSSANL